MASQPVWFWLLLFAVVSCAAQALAGCRHADRPRLVFMGGTVVTGICLILAHLIRADFRPFTLVGIVIFLGLAVTSVFLRAKRSV